MFSVMELLFEVIFEVLNCIVTACLLPLFCLLLLGAHLLLLAPAVALPLRADVLLLPATGAPFIVEEGAATRPRRRTSHYGVRRCKYVEYF